jgi:hypothetical protein
MRIIFPVLISLLDGLSDIYYLVDNWDDIATPELKSLLVFFTFDYILLMSLMLIYLDIESK